MIKIENGISYEFKIAKITDNNPQSYSFGLSHNKMIFRRNQQGYPSVNGEFSFTDEVLTPELMAYYFEESVNFLEASFKELLQKGI